MMRMMMMMIVDDDDEALDLSLFPVFVWVTILVTFLVA